MVAFQSVNVKFNGISPDPRGVVTKTQLVKLDSGATTVGAAILGWTLEFNSRNGNNHNVRALGAQVGSVRLINKHTAEVVVNLRLTDDNENFVDPDTSSVQLLLIGS